MKASVYVNPFQGVAESAVTSNTIDTRYAFDIGCSFYTASGTTNEHYWWISNDLAPYTHSDGAHTVTEATWSRFTTFADVDAAVSGASFFDPPLGFRWARITRETSRASVTVYVNIMEDR